MFFFLRVLIFQVVFAMIVSKQETREFTDDLRYDYDVVENLYDPYMEPISPFNGYEFDVVDLLDLSEKYQERLERKPSLRNSASKFLLEVYNEITANERELDHVREHLALGSRQKRALREDNFITKFDRMEIEKCNNIITFSCKKTLSLDEGHLIPNITIASDMQIGFKTTDVPRDLQLIHAALRIYQQPSCGKYVQDASNQKAKISIYQHIMYRGEYTGHLRIITSANTSITYKGWLEFNVTRALKRWLQQKSGRINELIVGVTLSPNNSIAAEILASDLGLITSNISEDIIDLQPFVIGYFNEPELMVKIQKLRFKREVLKRKRKAIHNFPPERMREIYETPKTCERLNFTVDFKKLNMHNWVIAPKTFEAYFCGGGCNFPLSSKMNATNHAIVQTLMHLKQPELPKPCCVPTVFDSILFLHYLNEDSVNLRKYPQSVAKECGCH